MNKSIETLEQLLNYKLNIFVVGRKLFFSKQVDNKLYIYNSEFKYRRKINLYNLRDILKISKYTILMKFYQLNDSNIPSHDLKIKFLSQLDCNLFVENILPRSYSRLNVDYLFFGTMLNLLKDHNQLANYLVNTNIQKLREKNFLHNENIYDILILNNPKYEKNFLKKIIFVFSEEGRLFKVFNSFFYGIPCKFRNFKSNQENLRLLITKKKRIMFYLLKNKSSDSISTKKKKLKLDSNSFEKVGDMSSPSPRTRRHIDFGDKKNKKHSGTDPIHEEQKETSITMTTSDRIIFYVWEIGYFGRRHPYMIEIKSDYFIISEKSKVKILLFRLTNS